MGSISMMVEGTCESFDLDEFTQFSLSDKDCCSAGMFLQDAPAGNAEGIIYMLLQLAFLCYIFLGVALGADVFMQSIEVITSKELTKTVKNDKGEASVFHVRVWNATVANLTLMALGSSAPEILLSVIEVMAEGMATGPLGPSTIVGSAAFNLMIITAVCIIAIPEGETRTIKQLGVFLTTAAYSVFAYVWLMIIVIFWTPQVITVVEGALTLVFFVLLVINAYWADKHWDKMTTWTRTTGITAKDAAMAIKKAGLGKDATPEQIAEALQDNFEPPKSRAYYKHKAVAGNKKKMGGKVAPELDLSAPAGDGAAAKGGEEGGAHARVPSSPPDAESPGVISFEKYLEKIPESGGSVTVRVLRHGGSKGEVSVQYNTKDQATCKAGKDYEATNGTLTFADGDTEAKIITVVIFDDDEYEKDEHFTIVLSEPTGGATFDSKTDGGEDADVCTVIILNDDDRQQKLSTAMRMLKFDSDVMDVASADYWTSVRECFVYEDDATGKDKFMHWLTFPWKFMFKALVPPAALGGGWPCFVFALIWIGFQVVLISDFATQMGCQMYLPDTITAITFVALGTSLPDTFASMQAARGDKTADSSIGNVTGSNSVNVFLGLGLPWLIGSVYWAISGPNSEWHEKYGPFAVNGVPINPREWQKGMAMPTGMNWEDYGEYTSSAAFFVSSTGLGFSVLVFTILAISTIAIILMRRKLDPPAELGGSKATAKFHAGILVTFWFIYVILSCMSDPQFGVFEVDI